MVYFCHDKQDKQQEGFSMRYGKRSLKVDMFPTYALEELVRFSEKRESASGSSETICCLWGGNKIRNWII